ncbi:hypothetical protein Mapa_014416 [Marchantia paleacea]|nr:hypothetical protein Mapa_014416 [Marchantia paleacea]
MLVLFLHGSHTGFQVVIIWVSPQGGGTGCAGLGGSAIPRRHWRSPDSKLPEWDRTLKEKRLIS